MNKMLLVLCLVIIASMAGCGGSPTAPDPEPEGIEGIYNIKTIGNVPFDQFVFNEPDGRTGVVVESLIDLRKDGSFSRSVKVRVTLPDGHVTQDDLASNGTWTVSGDRLSLSSDVETVVTTLGVRTISWPNNFSGPWVYEK